MTTDAAPVDGRRGRMARFAAGLAFLLLVGGCDRIWPRQPDLTLPTVEEVREIYRANGVDADIEYRGNVVELRIVQSGDQLRRGGSLWARVGPWIYVFSPATQQVLETYAGVAAVRVITRSGGREVARATLRRGVLTDVLWRRSLNILGHALQEGTRDPARLQQLAEWGERYGEYEYSTDFVPRQ